MKNVCERLHAVGVCVQVAPHPQQLHVRSLRDYVWRVQAVRVAVVVVVGFVVVFALVVVVRRRRCRRRHREGKRQGAHQSMHAFLRGSSERGRRCIAVWVEVSKHSA